MGSSGGAWFGPRWAMAHPKKKSFFSTGKLQKYPELKEFSQVAHPTIQPFHLPSSVMQTQSSFHSYSLNPHSIHLSLFLLMQILNIEWLHGFVHNFTCVIPSFSFTHSMCVFVYVCMYVCMSLSMSLFFQSELRGSFLPFVDIRIESVLVIFGYQSINWF